MKTAKRVAVTLGAAGAIGVVLGATFIGRGQSDAKATAATSRPASLPAAAAAVRHPAAGADRPAGLRGAPPDRVLGFSGTSAIPAGELQLCAQGDYAAGIYIANTPIPGTLATTEGLRIIPLEPNPPNNCAVFPFDTHGATVQVEIYGWDAAAGHAFSLGSTPYNSASGLGLGAEGTTASPDVWQW